MGAPRGKETSMAEILVEFDAVLRGPDGLRYQARACGVEGKDGRWKGWLEFETEDGTAAVRTGRETTQRNREELLYWASGLTAGYLDGALGRVLAPPRPPRRRDRALSRPAFDGPAPEPVPGDAMGSSSPDALSEGVERSRQELPDPHRLYAAGEEVLRRSLRALGRQELIAVMEAHELSRAEAQELGRLTREQLVSLIVRAVQERHE